MLELWGNYFGNNLQFWLILKTNDAINTIQYTYLNGPNDTLVRLVMLLLLLRVSSWFSNHTGVMKENRTAVVKSMEMTTHKTVIPFDIFA